MGWLEHYRHKLVSPEEAVCQIDSGDLVKIPIGPQPNSLMLALAARRDELRGVQVWVDSLEYDPGWFQLGWQDSLQIVSETIIGSIARSAYSQHLVDYSPMLFCSEFKGYKSPDREGKQIDILMIVVSPPDKNGFCSFGGELWSKRGLVSRAKKVLAQVDEEFIHTYGKNFVHVSEIDYFVNPRSPVVTEDEINESISLVVDADVRKELTCLSLTMDLEDKVKYLPRLQGLSAAQIRTFGVTAGWFDSPAEVKKISSYVSEVIKDGDTIQIGYGTPSQLLVVNGVLDGKRDIGWHSELGAPGVISLIEKGLINGSKKTMNKNQAIFTGLAGARSKELLYACNNPKVHLLDADHVVNIQTIARQTNMVSINNALSVDFSGQINSESIFGQQYSGTGGQLCFQIGAVLAKGGRAITLLRSTARGGTVSRIVSQLDMGATVTVPRTFADIVITEYGIAFLLGKSIRERARELIAIAHPDFRSDLRQAAGRLLYP